MIELPHGPADLTGADAALAGARDPSAMVAALRRVIDGRGRQAERVDAAAAVLEARRAALAEAERVHQAEAASLAHLDRAITSHESTIQEARDRRRRDREAADRLAAEREAHRQRLIADGLARLGKDGRLIDVG